MRFSLWAIAAPFVYAPVLSVAQTAEHSMPAVIVTATPLGSELFEMVTPVDVLYGRDMRLKQRSTLGETLSQEPGVSATQFGPNASRPIIRGLDGDRIRVLQNGAGVLDASSASFDHAVSIEPLLIDRIEVLRGPAALLYGGNAVGGVVNVVDGRIPRFRLDKAFSGTVDLRTDSARGEAAGAARLETGNEHLALHFDVFTRDTDDLRIPGYARSSALRASDPQPAEARGELPNSASQSDGGAAGVSLLFGERGYTGLSFQRYNSEYGTVAEEEVSIHLRQERWDLAGELRDLSSSVRALKYKFGHSDYKHKELEGTEVGTVFRNKGYDSRVELLHAPIGPLEGAIGLQLGDFDFSAVGDEAFLPGTRTRNIAAFVYEEWRLGRAEESIKLSFGARIERSEVEADAFAASGAPADERKFNLGSGSIGALIPLSGQYAIAANFAYTERAATFQELYADGPHIATDAFEVGDRDLGKEKSTAFDLSLRREDEDWRGSLSVFYNRFRNYIGLMPALDAATGDPLFRDAEDRSLPASTSTAGFAEPMQQYNYEAVGAVFRGFEVQFAMPLWRRGGQKVEMELRGDYTWAENRDSDEALPRIPPLRWGGAMTYSAERLNARLDVLRAEEQDRVPDGELSTNGYTMLDASLAYRLRGGSVDWELFLKGSNLLDEEARLATSFLKDIAPLAGRSLSVGLRADF